MDPLLDIQNLHVRFALRSGTVRAVRGVSLSVGAAEAVGIVGESGSGKSVLCLSILRLLQAPPARIDGRILFEGDDILTLSPRALRALRGNRISMVFQDPSTSLNPYLRIVQQVSEPLFAHGGGSRTDMRRAAVAALEEAGIDNALSRAGAYPHEFSGGMRQRATIAMALISKPSLLIADEPTTALDVTVQAQILRLFSRFREQRSMSVLFVTHNLAVAGTFCDRVAVMYAGQILELASARNLFAAPAHPYTRALIRSIPDLRGETRSLYTIEGTPPDLSREIVGCPFAPRCEYRRPECIEQEAVLREIKPGHASACIRVCSGETLW